MSAERTDGKNETQSEGGSGKRKGNTKRGQGEGEKKVGDLAGGTKMVDSSFGREYEKMVNSIFRDKLLRECKGYFKTNLKLQGIHNSHQMFQNWALIQKSQKTQDDLSKTEPKQGNVEDEQMDNFVRDIEIDGAAYVSEAKSGQQDFSIVIEGTTLAFKAPCIILIEIALLSDVETMTKKLKQLIKDYVFLKSDLGLLRQLISDDKGNRSEDQMLEAEKLYISISPANLVSQTKIYLVCATNNSKKEGLQSFETAWEKISQEFELGLIDCLFNKKECQPLNVDQFRNDHVKQVHVQSAPYSNFLSQVNELPDKIDAIEKDLATFNKRMDSFEEKMVSFGVRMEERMDSMEVRMEEKMEERMDSMEVRMEEKMEERMASMEVRMEEKMEERMASMEVRMEEKMEERMASMEVRMEEKMEEKMVSMEVKLVNKIGEEMSKIAQLIQEIQKGLTN